MPPRRPRRHHTVPRLYLRAFSEGNQIVMRLRGRETDEVRNITSVAFTRDFYAFTLGGVPDATLEEWLERNVEGPGAPALRRAVDGQWPPTPDDRAAIATFAAFQLLRTPLVRDYMHQIDRTIAPLLWAAEVLGRALETTELTVPERRRVFDEARARMPASLSQRADPRALLRTMLREADREAARLSTRHWSLFRSSEPSLVTSDNPVARFFPQGQPAGFRGLAPSEAELHLPLAPDTLLIFERYGATANSRAGQLSAELAAAANSAQALGAQRAIFRHPATAWPPQLVLGPNAPQLPEPRITARFENADSPTFPAEYGPIHDARIEELLRRHGAQQTVR